MWFICLPTMWQLCIRSAGVRIVKTLVHKDYGQDAFVLEDPDGNRVDAGQRTT